MNAIPGVGAKRSIGFGGGGVAGGGAALAPVEVSVLASVAASARVSAMIFVIENFSGIAGSRTGRMAGAPWWALACAGAPSAEPALSTELEGPAVATSTGPRGSSYVTTPSDRL